MHRGSTNFRKQFGFRFLTCEELQSFISTVELRFNAHAFGYELKSVRPEKFRAETHNFPVSKVFDAIRNHASHVRVYEICFSATDIKDRALADVVSLGICVVCRSKFGDNDEKERLIELRGLNCCKSDFDYFIRATDQILALAPYFPPGIDAHDTAMSAFVDAPFLLSEAKAIIYGSIRTQQYDVAIRALTALIESNLRDRLVSHGVASAETAAGADLAQIAFDKESGQLAPPWDIAAESLQGVHLMLRGFFLWIRNGFQHHAHILSHDKDGALELVQLCNALLKIIEKSRPR